MAFRKRAGSTLTSHASLHKLTELATAVEDDRFDREQRILNRTMSQQTNQNITPLSSSSTSQRTKDTIVSAKKRLAAVKIRATDVSSFEERRRKNSIHDSQKIQTTTPTSANSRRQAALARHQSRQRLQREQEEQQEQEQQEKKKEEEQSTATASRDHASSEHHSSVLQSQGGMPKYNTNTTARRQETFQKLSENPIRLEPHEEPHERLRMTRAAHESRRTVHPKSKGALKRTHTSQKRGSYFGLYNPKKGEGGGGGSGGGGGLRRGGGNVGGQSMAQIRTGINEVKGRRQGGGSGGGGSGGGGSGQQLRRVKSQEDTVREAVQEKRKADAVRGTIVPERRRPSQGAHMGTTPASLRRLRSMSIMTTDKGVQSNVKRKKERK